MQHERVVLEPPSGAEGEAVRDYAARRGFLSFLLAAAPVRAGRSGLDLHVFSEGRVRRAGGRSLGVVRVVSKPSDLPPVVELLRRHPVVVVEFVGDRVIPLENLIAMRQGLSGKVQGHLWVRARSAVEVPSLLGALEHGSEKVLLRVRTPADVDEIEALLDRPTLHLTWKNARLLRVSPGGIGERVAVDTTSLLAPDEGLLVGSQGAFLLHVVSEAQGSRYTRPRPFRVNAGAVHSYTLMADGTTRYLSELEPGDRIAVARPGGTPRAVRVGRLKIERRPMTLLEVSLAGRQFTLFAQEAETVRLSTPRGPRPVPELRPTDRLVGVALPPARHFGMAVEEELVER